MNNRTTYQAKIIKPDGFPLEAVNVNFKFTILDPSASCVLYSEEYSAVNMQNTGGLIFFSLGAGNRTYPSSGATTFEYVLDNSVVSFACETPGLYVPTSADNRKIVMQFNDGNGWQTLPAMAINSVPYAMYAGKSDNAVKLNGKSDSAFVEYSTLASLSCNSATHAITFNGASFSCIAVDSSGTAVTSSTIVAALGYTPAQGTSFTSLDSTVSSVSSAVYSVSSTVSNLNSSVTSLSNSVAASFAAISSSQWQNIAGGIKYASGTVTIGDAANNALMTLYTPDSGSVSHGLVLIDRNAGYGSWQNPSGLDGVSADSSGTVTGWGQLYFNYYSSGSIDFNRGGGYSKFNGGVAIGMPMPAARLHIGAGTSSTAPLRFVAGTLLTSAAAGAIEYDGTDYYFTDNSNTRRSLSAIAASGVTSAGIISSLGYTPADNANVTSLTSTVASSFTTLTNSVNTTGSSITTLTTTVNTLSTSITNLTAAVSGIATGAKVARFATLANITLSGLQTIDGSAVAAGDRVLVKNQTLRRNNGLYIAAAGAWTRAPELDTWTEILGAEVYVVEGLSNQGMAYMANTTNINGTLNTTNIEWTVRGSNYWNTNIAFGLDALTKNISGYDNAAFGNYSQSIVTTGSENTGVGNYTLEDLTTGNKNTAVGTAAMTGVSSGSLNTALGYRALASMSTGDGNIGIGANAGWLITTGSNNVVIGSNTGSSIATSSNNILLSDGQGNERMRIDSFGNVGIGTTTPNAKLQIAAGTSSTAPLKFIAGTLLASASAGAIEYDGADYYFTDNSNTRRSLSSIAAAGVTSTGIVSSLGYTPANAVSVTALSANVSSLGASFAALTPSQWVTNGSNIGYTTGSIGIGTTSPAFKLELSGTATNADRKIGINGKQVVYLPDQINFQGSIFVGDGGQSLSYISGADGKYNIGVGLGALFENTTGSENAATGYNALQYNTTGGSNVANGANALQYNTTGFQNVAVGGYALRNNITGINNTATGAYSLYTNTTGSYNIATGTNALQKNTTGGTNIAIGTSAIFNNISGSYNTAAGGSSLYDNTTGNNNVAYGYQALSNSKTKSESTAIGYSSMRYADSVSAAPTVSFNTAVGAYSLQGSTTAASNTGTNNTAVGHSALKLVTAGSGNVGIGSNAGGKISSGYSNVAVGRDALPNNTTGYDNVAVGAYALDYNTTGNANTGVGGATLFYNTTGNNNAAFGFQALLSNLTGSQNTAIGTQALLNNVTGNYNVATGSSALRANISGNNNVATGLQTLTGNTTGSYNTANGSYAMTGNSTGNNNVAYGFQALYWNSTKSESTAIGYNSMMYADSVSAAVSPSYNTAVGAYSLQGSGSAANNTGTRNTAIGHSALQGMTSGFGNVGVGYRALYGNTTGTNNVANGINSLFANTTGDTNVAIGTTALNANTTGAKNVGIGSLALNSNTTGNFNIALGYAAGSSITTGSFNVVIGANAGATIATSSNNILISDGAGNERLRVDSTGNVGIGTTAPSAQLDVSGTITMSSSSESISTYVNTGANYTIPGTNLNIRRLTLDSNTTITLPAYIASSTKVFTLTVFVKQDATGTRSLNFAGNGSDTIKWDSGAAPSISATANKITILQFTKPSDETVWYGSKVWQED